MVQERPSRIKKTANASTSRMALTGRSSKLLNLGRVFPVELFWLATRSDKSRHGLSPSTWVRGYCWRLSFESGRSGGGVACSR